MTLLLLIALPIVAATVSVFFGPLRKFWILEWTAVVATAVEFTLGVRVALGVLNAADGTQDAYFAVDAFGAIVLVTLTVVAFMTALYSVGYLREEVKKGIIGFRRVRQYFVLFHLFLAAMFFATMTTSPIMMWIAIEATTLSTAFLISFYNKPSGMEAAWKYLIINSLGLLLGFLGTLLFFTSALPTPLSALSGFVDWATLRASAPLLDPLIVKFAFILVLIGYGTKIGFVPMHTWKPDAYAKAPAPVVALFSGALVNVAFLALIRFKVVTDLALSSDFSGRLLMLFGIISILLAAFIIFTQNNYKRLLAYSSIEHGGIMALGFGFGGLGAFAAILHMVYHSFAKSALFFGAGNIFLKYGSSKIGNVSGALKTLPVTSVLVVMAVLAIAGLPPFGIFLTEFTILFAGITVNPALAVTAIAGITLVFIGFLKHVTAMMWGEPPEGVSEGEASAWTIVPIVFLVAALLFSGFVLPSPFRTLVESAAESIQK